MKRLIILILSLLLYPFFLFTQDYTLSSQLKIDQIGYLPEGEKVAIISQAQSGYNAPETYSPPTTLELRSALDHSSVFSGNVVAWKNGQTHDQSGDKVWHFDFSAFKTNGTYYVYDPVNGVGSYPFQIAENVYAEVLKQAVRTFYYQRCGTDKPAAYAGDAYADGVNFMGPNQDVSCRLYSNAVASTARDLSGGWFDAGDYNKYVNFAFTPVIDLLFAYLHYPAIWTDDYNIPESGNGVPDLLDEVKWELDWLLRMQEEDGGILSVVGGGFISPPSAETSPRYYGPATTAASFSAAAMLALGAIAFEEAGKPSYANSLLSAAVKAYQWGEAHPNKTFYNAGQLAAGEQQLDGYGTFMVQLSAASFLYAKTGEQTYKAFVENRYTDSHLLQWGWVSMYEESYHKALLYFTKQFGVNNAVANDIMEKYVNSVKTAGDHLASYQNGEDPYRAYLASQNYTWGSNNTKGSQANIFLNMINFALESGNAVLYQTVAAGYLHYFHGLNPNNLIYLTKMEAFGGENSCQEIYHSWFGNGTIWDNSPPPAYVVGGPNPTYSLDGCCASNSCANLNSLCDDNALNPPFGQPIQKAYKDFNTSWPQNSWQLSEPAIYYQASYIKLLAGFVKATSPTAIKQRPADELHLQLFPNPTDGKLQVISHSDAIEQLVIYDLAGRALLQKRFPAATGTVSLELAHFEKGLYLLEVITRSGRKGIRKWEKH